MTRSMVLELYDEPYGLCRGGSGRIVAGVYGNEKLAIEVGVCDSDGAALKLMCDAEARW
jgi:hypothetical protein